MKSGKNLARNSKPVEDFARLASQHPTFDQRQIGWRFARCAFDGAVRTQPKPAGAADFEPRNAQSYLRRDGLEGGTLDKQEHRSAEAVSLRDRLRAIVPRDNLQMIC